MTKASLPSDVSNRNTTAVLVDMLDDDVPARGPRPGVLTPEGVVSPTWILGVGRLSVKPGVPGFEDEAKGDDAGR